MIVVNRGHVFFVLSFSTQTLGRAGFFNNVVFINLASVASLFSLDWHRDPYEIFSPRRERKEMRSVHSDVIFKDVTPSCVLSGLLVFKPFGSHLHL